MSFQPRRLGHALLKRLRFRLVLSGLFVGSCAVCLLLGQVSLATPQTGLAEVTQADQIVQQGVDRYQNGDYQAAIKLWQIALSAYQQNHHRLNEAIVRENLARSHQQLGQTERAIAEWEKLVVLYRQLKEVKQVGRMLTEQAQAYSSLGQPRKAIDLLCGSAQATPQEPESPCLEGSALQIARIAKDSPGEVAALGSLGDAYRLRGDYDQAVARLQEGRQRAQASNQTAYAAAVLNSLGTVYAGQAQVSYRRAEAVKQAGDDRKATQLNKTALEIDTQAQQQFEESLRVAREQNDLQAQMRSLLNLIPVYYRTQTAASTAVQTALKLLEQLPDSQSKVYSAIDLVHLLQPPAALNRLAARDRCLQPNLQPQAITLLQQAITTAQRIQDRRSESFALGELGYLYECRQAFAQALQLTQQARWAADQDLRAKDSLYLWEWQTGRLLIKQGQKNAAIAAYERAITTLTAIRNDILAANRDVQFDFRDTIDPIYREYVALKLSQEQPIQSASKAASPNRSKNLRLILETIDSLKLAELQNYFGNDCVLTAIRREAIDLAAETSTAVFDTVILEDRAAVIVSLPNGQRSFNWIEVDRQDLTEQINQFRRGLEQFRNREAFDPQPAQQIYNWLIRPFATELKAAQIKTLVFVQDGILRSVPMAALHDGEKFLVQDYAISTTPSLTLTDPKVLDRRTLRVLALGLTKSALIDQQQFPALTNVSKEISGIRQQVPGSKQLLDEEFTPERLQLELSKTVYPIIHIATHGKFGIDPQDTFIVTGNNQKLTLSQLDEVIRKVTRNADPLELLTLTACETATGDDRAALGLAGIAVQAGARSALASLWFINDAATAKVATDFYANLRNPNLTKAEALQAAQKALIEGSTIDGVQYTHPAYWSPFVLIGNWL